MKKLYLDEFEELVLLTIASLAADAYGVSIKEFIETRTQRIISIGTLHSTFTRLEEKDFITSYMGEPTAERGGRRKRFYEVTKSGKIALYEMKEFRDELWVTAKRQLSLSK
jgi:DNA-binding PadR family transcriptional regulator